MILIEVPVEVAIERPESDVCSSLFPPPSTIEAESVEATTSTEVIVEEATVPPEDMTAEQLEDSLTATLYMDTSGDPDL